MYVCVCVPIRVFTLVPLRQCKSHLHRNHFDMRPLLFALLSMWLMLMRGENLNCVCFVSFRLNMVGRTFGVAIFDACVAATFDLVCGSPIGSPIVTYSYPPPPSNIVQLKEQGSGSTDFYPSLSSLLRTGLGGLGVLPPPA